MTKQDKRAKSAAVELDEAALDQAAGGVLASAAIGRGSNVAVGDVIGDGPLTRKITASPSGGNYV